MRKAIGSSACYHSHSHDEFSFGVIDKGSAKYINLNKTQRIVKGDTVLINPSDIHSCNPDNGDWSYRMLFVDTHWVGNLQTEFWEAQNTDYQTFKNYFETEKSFYKQFSHLFSLLINETNALQAESQLILFLKRCFKEKKVSKNSKHKTIKSEDYRLRRVNELLMDELATNHSLSDLSLESGLSRYHLIRCFKEVYGLSPHALQLDERIKKAKVLLKAGHALLDISNNLGFADQSHFQRNFKKRMALTPKQYQNFFI